MTHSSRTRKSIWSNIRNMFSFIVCTIKRATNHSEWRFGRWWCVRTSSNSGKLFVNLRWARLMICSHPKLTCKNMLLKIKGNFKTLNLRWIIMKIIINLKSISSLQTFHISKCRTKWFKHRVRPRTFGLYEIQCRMMRSTNLPCTISTRFLSNMYLSRLFRLNLRHPYKTNVLYMLLLDLPKRNLNLKFGVFPFFILLILLM